MRDLEFFEMPIGKIKLERLDVWNKRHIKETRGLRDLKARTMCFDLNGLVNDYKRGRDRSGSSFLVKDKENDMYIGYVYISNRHSNGERVLSYIVNKKLRNRGYGTIMITSVSDYLLEHDLANEVQLYIRENNSASMQVALKSGFKNVGSISGDMEKFSKRR